MVTPLAGRGRIFDQLEPILMSNGSPGSRAFARSHIRFSAVLRSRNIETGPISTMSLSPKKTMAGRSLKWRGLSLRSCLLIAAFFMAFLGEEFSAEGRVDQCNCVIGSPIVKESTGRDIHRSVPPLPDPIS